MEIAGSGALASLVLEGKIEGPIKVVSDLHLLSRTRVHQPLTINYPRIAANPEKAAYSALYLHPFVKRFAFSFPSRTAQLHLPHGRLSEVSALFPVALHSLEDH